MEVTTRSADGSYIFETAATPQKSGRHGYTVRILPHHPDLAGQLIPGLIVWAVDTGLRPAISAAPA
jgi:starch phosphorylase